MIHIRDERPEDAVAIRDVNRLAFGRDDEGQLVDALRAAGAATLSLVATDNDVVVGHILFSPVSVEGMHGSGLAPMSVRPDHQRQGIGSRLVEAGLDRLRGLGCPFAVVLGHPRFYPRFGFRPASGYGVTCDWDVPAEVFMVALLNPDTGVRLHGRAKYRHEFSSIA